MTDNDLRAALEASLANREDEQAHLHLVQTWLGPQRLSLQMRREDQQQARGITILLAALEAEGYTLVAPPTASLDAAWAEAEAALPERWVIDGIRAQYTDGAITGWVARSIVWTPLPDKGYTSVPLRTGEGPAPTAALLALAEKLRTGK